MYKGYDTATVQQIENREQTSSSSFPLHEDGGSKNILGITCVYLCN